jgi:hypothetical protein
MEIFYRVGVGLPEGRERICEPEINGQFGKNYRMVSCAKCEGFSQSFNISSMREYRDIVRQLIQIVGEGTFWLVRGSCPLQEVFNTPMPGDSIHHDFQCLACGRRFHLGADTYHGNAHWTVGDVPERDDRSKPN